MAAIFLAQFRSNGRSRAGYWEYSVSACKTDYPPDQADGRNEDDIDQPSSVFGGENALPDREMPRIGLCAISLDLIITLSRIYEMINQS